MTLGGPAIPLESQHAFSARRCRASVRGAVGLILLTAAALKVFFPTEAQLWPLDRWWPGAAWPAAALVAFEVLLGGWLLSGVRPGMARWTAIACFAAFLVVMVAKGAAGLGNCGCFGSLSVNPWLAAGLDLGVVVLLVWARPDHNETSPSICKTFRAGRLVLGTVAAVVASFASWHVLAAGPQVMDGTAETAKATAPGPVILATDQWVGKRLPLLDHLAADVRNQLAAGRWLVVLHRHDCPACGELIAGLRNELTAPDRARSAIRVALIELPPHDIDASDGSDPFLRARLPDDRQWIATAPTVLHLQDAVVTTATEGSGAGQTAKTSIAAAPPLARGQSHDLGYVEPSGTRRIVFRVSNPSDAPLRIEQTKIECSCLQPAAMPEAIPANGTVDIEIAFTAPRVRTAGYAKRVWLITDDPARRAIALTVAADIGIPLQLEPAELTLPVHGPGQVATGRLRLVNRGSKPVRPLYATTSDTACVAQVGLAAPAGGSTEILLRVGPFADDPPAEPIRVRVHTDSPDQPALEASVRLQTPGGFVSPVPPHPSAALPAALPRERP